MATGPEHYRHAEALAAEARNSHTLTSEGRALLASLAQTHATLALAAAMGTYGTAEETRTAADANAWEYAAGEYTAQRRAERWEAEHAAEDGDENHFTRAQLDGEACTVCGRELADGEPTVPSAHDFIEGQLFAHAACLESEA